MTRQRGPMARRTCPLCSRPTTVTPNGKVGKHRDAAGETCNAVGLLFTTAQKKARHEAAAARVEALRDRLDPDDLGKLERALRDRDHRLAESMLDSIEARS
jgi:hypothetical protein